MTSLIVINGLLACAVLAFFCIALVLHQKLRDVAHAAGGQIEEVGSRIAQIDATVQSLASDAETQKAMIASRVPAVALNLNKRSQALAMHRKGERPESIASTLMMPRAEVELLLKVQRAGAEGTRSMALAG